MAGIPARTWLEQWGNSAAVRIPASVMDAMHLHLDEVVEVREEKGRIIIEPVRQEKYVLEGLLKRITAKNRMRQLISDLRKAKRSGDGKAVRARCRRDRVDQLHPAGGT
jgi:antitoxin MazE